MLSSLTTSPISNSCEDYRRRYAAVEAQKIGYGGIAYFSRLFGMSRTTISMGIVELSWMSEDDPDNPQRPSGHPDAIHRPGSGRPKAIQSRPGLGEAFEEILDVHTAGSLTDETVLWTDLKPKRLLITLSKVSYSVAPNTAADLLAQVGYRSRALRKELMTG